MIGGFSVTPEVSAVASVVTEGKMPAVIMVPSTPALMKMSPYFVRTANNMISTVAARARTGHTSPASAGPISWWLTLRRAMRYRIRSSGSSRSWAARSSPRIAFR